MSSADTLPAGPNSPKGETLVCPECQSTEVRPSRSTYPHDRDKTAAGNSSFWRCGNCGARFLGSLAVERKRQGRERVKPKDPLDSAINVARYFKRWIFPFLVLLATVMAVIYVLDRRDAPPEEIIFPNE